MTGICFYRAASRERMHLRNIVMVIAAVAVVAAQDIKGRSQQSTTNPADALAFEVASVKPLQPPFPTGGGPWTASRGRFRAEVAFLRSVLAFVYDLLPGQIKGGPDWIDRDPYFFDARSENAEAGPNQIKAMMRTLLADRFKLVVHRETRQAQVYTLTVGNNGLKLQEVKDARQQNVSFGGPGRVRFVESSLLPLTGILSDVLDAPVRDLTGLRGWYSFSLEFAMPGEPQRREADSRPDLFTSPV